MKMRLISAKWVAVAALVGMLPTGAFATTCKGSAGAVYLLAQDIAHTTTAGDTQHEPIVGDKGLTIGGPKGFNLPALSAPGSGVTYCSNNGAGSADTHYPTGVTYSA